MDAVPIANSPIISHNLSSQIISVKHKNNYHHIQNHHSRKIERIINETEDSIQSKYYNDDNKEEEDYKHHHNYHYHNNSNNHRYHHHSHHHRSSSHHKSSRYHHRYPNKHNHQPGNSESMRRGKKRKRDVNTDDNLSDDTMSSQPIQPRKRRKKSMDDDSKSCEEKNARKKHRSHHSHHHRHRSSHSDMISGSASSASASSDCSYYAKSKRRKSKHQMQQQQQNEEKTEEHHHHHLSPSPSLSISSLTITKSIKSPSLSPTHRRSSYHSDSDDSSMHSVSSHKSKRRHKKKKKKHYESDKAHNRTPQSSECDTPSDTDSDSSSMSSSSSSSRSFRQSKRTTKSKQRECRESSKVPTTRNLILTGQIKWDRMREEDIRREIQRAFGSETSVQFWKYCMQMDGVSYCKHLNCISVSFETSKQCQDNFKKFVLGMIDLNVIGHAINLSMDQHKNRANKLYAQHVDEQKALRKSIFGKKNSSKEDSKCNGNEPEMMANIGRCYLLPTAIEPLQCFKRPQIATKVKQCDAQKEEIIKEPMMKKRKLIKMEGGVHKRIMSSPQKQKHLKSSQDILSLVGKIDKKKDVKLGDIRINKLMKKEKKTTAIIQSKKKLTQHSHALSQKSAVIKKVKTSKHCIETKEKHREQQQQQQQREKEKKSKKRKHNSDFKTPKKFANSSRIKNVSIQKPKKEKIIKTPKRKKKKKTWRDYLFLYDGKERLAQLHIECLRSFKLQLIEKCVDDEYDRMMIAAVKQQKKNAPSNTKKQQSSMKKTKISSQDRITVKKEIDVKMKKKESDTLKTPQSPQQNTVPSKIINIPYPSTMNSNPMPFNLPQISFNAQQTKPPPPHYASQPIIKTTMPQYEHLTVSQPITASYPSQQITYNQTWYTHQNSSNAPPQYMPLYATPTIHGYQYHHTLPPQSTAYYATPTTLKSSANAIYPQLIATKQSKDKFPSLIPNFDISKASKPMYCDTVSSLSNTSNISNASCISSSHSITSILSKPEKAKVQKLKCNSNKHKKKELISSNGQWIIRQHQSGSARTEGFYSLAPSKNRGKKFRHLAAASNKDPKHSTKRRRILSQSQNMHNESLLLSKQKNIQFGKSSIHSWGVFALEDIASEEMVVEYIGEYIDEKVANLREKLYEKQGYDDYMFRVDDNLIIDATKKGNLARFINHSCDPNCYTRIINVNNTLRVVIYSKMQIKAGEELTYDYKFPIEDDKIVCLCSSRNCRGTLN